MRSGHNVGTLGGLNSYFFFLFCLFRMVLVCRAYKRPMCTIGTRRAPSYHRDRKDLGYVVRMDSTGGAWRDACWPRLFCCSCSC